MPCGSSSARAAGQVLEPPARCHDVRQYKWRPTFRIGSILSGLFLALGIQLMLQQTGAMEFTALRFWLAVVLGGLAGMFLSWGAHAVACQGAKRRFDDA